MQDLLGEELSVIVNTGDDVEALGVHVSPDPDLVTYWLNGEIDADRGWGIAGDSFTVFERLVALGAPEWFGLSDRDLATCLRRRELLASGERQTEVQMRISVELGARSRVIAMCDEPVRTRVLTDRGWIGLQEYLVRERAEPEVQAVEFDGVEAASASAEVRDAIAGAEAIVIGPSNPVISIGPILAVPGVREAIEASAAPVVAVSPYVGGRIVKGPTNEFMRASGREQTSVGVAEAYSGVADGIVIDSEDPGPPPAGLATLSTPTLMDSAAARRGLAERVLEFARSLG
jgi:LPPG:FO 2-phospho-L-lactate transferase